jgi:hypothetical protein
MEQILGPSLVKTKANHTHIHSLSSTRPHRTNRHTPNTNNTSQAPARHSALTPCTQHLLDAHAEKHRTNVHYFPFLVMGRRSTNDFNTESCFEVNSLDTNRCWSLSPCLAPTEGTLTGGLERPQLNRYLLEPAGLEALQFDHQVLLHVRLHVLQHVIQPRC